MNWIEAEAPVAAAIAQFLSFLSGLSLSNISYVTPNKD